MIEVRDLTKVYGESVAVDHVSFTVEPGVVTGFLGPNGAGKSTTMRMVLGLDRPTSGVALVNGRSYTGSAAPLAELGALLDARAVDKGRSARDHLRAVGATVGVGKRRVDEVLDLVGLAEVAGKPAGGFSLGMGQRLGLATALIADPAVLMLDEPVNGLDPDGILWIRGLLRDLAAEGRTVFVSSHLMSEMELTADHLVVIGRGRILADTSMSEFIASASPARVAVSSPDADRLRRLLAADGVTVTSTSDADLVVEGVPAARIGDLAAAQGLRLHRLAEQAVSLEAAFMELTRDAVEYHGATTLASTASSLRSAA
jgi:ABC-2 type transport system ATP-binding protein